MKRSEYNRRRNKYNNRAVYALFTALVLFVVFFLTMLSWKTIPIVVFGSLIGGFVFICIYGYYDGKILSLTNESIEPDDGYIVNIDISVTSSLDN